MTAATSLHLCRQVDAIVFVVDSNDAERHDEARDVKKKASPFLSPVVFLFSSFSSSRFCSICSLPRPPARPISHAFLLLCLEQSELNHSKLNLDVFLQFCTPQLSLCLCSFLQRCCCSWPISGASQGCQHAWPGRSSAASVEQQDRHSGLSW